MDEQFVEMDSTSDVKTSLHVVLCGFHFANVSVVKRLTKTYLKTLFDDEKLDYAPYGKNTNFRFAECCKFMAKNAYLKILTDHTFEDAMITKIPEFSKLLHVPEEVKMPKKPRRTNFEIGMINLISTLLSSKLNDNTSEYSREQ